MMYRLVRLSENNEYAQVFDEENSELLGSILKTRRWMFFREYQLRLNDDVIIINRGLLSGRKWKVNAINVSFGLFGSGVSIQTNIDNIQGDKFNRGKMTLATQEGRTVAIIDTDALKSPNMVIIENFERLDRNELIGVALLILDRYKQW